MKNNLNYLPRMFILLLLIGVVKMENDFNSCEMPQPKVILNLIAGGTIDKINHIGHQVTNHFANITKIAESLEGQTCSSDTNLLDVVSKLLEKSGVINVDLREVLEMSRNPVINETMLKPVNKDRLATILSQSVDERDIINSARSTPKPVPVNTILNNINRYPAYHVGNLDHFKEEVNHEPSGINKLTTDMESYPHEILSSKGPNMPPIEESRGTFEVDMVADQYKQHINSGVSANREFSYLLNPTEDIETTLEKYKVILSYNMLKLWKFSKTPSDNKVSNPGDICKAFLTARENSLNYDSHFRLRLAKIAKISLSTAIEILEITEKLKTDNNLTYQGLIKPSFIAEMVSDQSYQELFLDPIGRYISETNLTTSQMIEHSLKKKKEEKMKIQEEIWHLHNLRREHRIKNDRSKRSLTFMSHIKEGSFTGYIRKGDIDVMPIVGHRMVFPKMRLNSKIFNNTMFPECPSISDGLSQLIKVGDLQSVMWVEISSGGICHFIRFCEMGHIINPVTLSCESSAIVTSKFYTNVDKFAVSDYIHRMGDIEMDTTLERQFDGYCSVGNLKLRQCRNTISSEETISVARVAGEWIIMREDVSLGYVPDVKKITSYDCTATSSSQLFNNENPGYISGCSKGDSHYLKTFSGEKQCSCGKSMTSGDIMAKYYGHVIPVDFIMYFKVQTKHPHDEPEINTCKDCEFTCSEGLIKITNNPQYSLLSICKYNLCEYFKIDSQKQTFQLSDPRPLLGKVLIQLYPNNTMLRLYKEEITCTLEDMCRLVTCIFCRDRLFNIHCSFWLSMALWSGALMIPISALWLLNGIFKTTYLIFKSVGKVLYLSYRIFSYLIRSCCGKARTHAENAYSSIGLDEVESNPVSNQLPKTKKANVFRPIMINPIHSVLILFIIIFSLITSGSNACSSESFLSMDSLHCSEGPVGKICNIRQDVLLTVSPIGQITCINIYNEDKTKIISQIQIKTVSLRLICNPSIRYYTVSTKPSITTTYRCSGAGKCSEEFCKSIGKTNSTEEIPHKEVFNMAGETGCKLVSGFWGNSCFYADSACKFYRVYFKPRGDTFEVFDCSSWDWMAQLEFKVISEKELIKKVFVTSSLPYSDETLLIKLSSISVKPLKLTSSCFLRKANVKFTNHPIATTSCNRETENIVGKVGEIRCPSAKDADSMTKRCDYVSNLFSVTTTGNDIQFRASVLDIDEIYTKNLIPKQFPGYTILQTKDGIPYIDTTDSSLFSLHLSFKSHPVSISEDSASCGSEFINITGCYKCNTGARVCLDSTSTLYPSIIKFQCPGSIPVLSTLGAKGKWCFNMHFNQESADLECSVSCGKGSQNLKIKGNLVLLPDKIYQKDDTDVQTNMVISKDWYSSLMNFFLGLSWPSVMAIACSLMLSLVVFYIMVFWVIPSIFNMLKGIRRRQLRNKTQSLTYLPLNKSS